MYIYRKAGRTIGELLGFWVRSLPLLDRPPLFSLSPGPTRCDIPLFLITPPCMTYCMGV